MIATIGVPCGDMIYTDHAGAMLSAAISTMKSKVHGINAVIQQKSPNIAFNRCELVQQAKNLKSDAIIFVDSDQTFPRETFVRLMESGKDIIGCNIVMRRPPFQSNTEDFHKKRINERRTGVEEVSRIGTGLLFVKMSVFEKLEKPYFTIGYFQESDKWITEDFWFCNKAKEAGFKIWVDHDLSKDVYHLGQYAFGLDDCERQNGIVKETV